ncbi:uncharacterized protein [Miscanthus floridulus]|uniref:uncharacterized protein n=1 Tax=Miscanthus floridulus TaxID=154761 RepID=UPI003457AEA3
MTNGSEMGDSNGTAVAADPLPEVVVRMVREVSGTNDMSALEAILVAIPAEYREPLGAKSFAKEVWEAIVEIRVGSDRAKKVTAQFLKQEYANLKFKDGEMEDFFGEEEADRPQRLPALRETGHWARECPNRKQEKKAEAHLVQANDDNEATILMAMFYALHDVEAEEKEEVAMVEGPGKALKAVNLDEPHAQVHLGRVSADQEKRWYLDSSASNHMTGSKASFSELDDDVTGTVKFGDGSRVAIQGCGTIILRCQNGSTAR